MEDLTTEENEEDFVEAEIEFTSRGEYIAAAYNAIAAVEGLNDMTMEDNKRKKRIMRKSVKIIDSIISEMYDELFEEDEEN
jgi:hypothetical protein